MKLKSEIEIINYLKTNSLEDTLLLCRICLTNNSEKLVSLFDTNEIISFSQKIMLCTKIQMHDDEGLPKVICQQCSEELEIANNFRIKCEYYDCLLRKLWSSDFKKKESLQEKEESNGVFQLKEEQVYVDSPHSSVHNESLEEEINILQNISKTSLEKITLKHRRKTVKKLPKEFQVPLDENDLRIKIELDISDTEYCNNSEDFKCQDLKTDDCKNAQNEDLKKYPCTVCNKLLKTQRSLVNHMNYVHKESEPTKIGKVTGFGVDRRYHCMYCDFNARRRQILIGHIRTHTGEKPYKCGDCLLHFSTSAGLCNHRKVHSDKMNFTCQECGKQFKMKGKYERHKSVHINEKKFRCSMCNKGLKSKITLEMHMNRHYNIKNYNCETCGATFVTSSELISHSKIHGTLKKFICQICNFATNSKAALEVHIRRHSGERPFKCELCEWTCYTPGSLKVHMRKHTKEKNYACIFCEQKFVHSSSLNKHISKSHGKNYRWNDLVDRRVIK